MTFTAEFAHENRIAAEKGFFHALTSLLFFFYLSGQDTHILTSHNHTSMMNAPLFHIASPIRNALVLTPLLSQKNGRSITEPA